MIVEKARSQSTVALHRRGAVFKDAFVAANIGTGGVPGKEFDISAEAASPILNRLRETYGQWVRDQFARTAPYLDAIPQGYVEQAFGAGVETFLLKHHRLARKQAGTINSSTLDNPQFMEDQIRTYTIDFALSLRISRRLGIPADKAVLIAKRAYALSPFTQSQLFGRFPEFGKRVLVRALLTNDNPVGYMEKARNQLDRLRDKYRDHPFITRNSIMSAINNHPSDPEGFLEKVDKRVTKIKENYPNISTSTILTVVMRNGKDQDKFFKGYSKKMDRLKAKFKTLKPWIVDHAIVNYRNPDDFLSEVEREIKQLREDNPTLDARVIDYVVVNHRKKNTNHQEVVDAFLKTCERLRAMFPDLDGKKAIQIALMEPRDPDGFIRHMQELIPGLLEKFPGKTTAQIIRAITYFPTRPEYRLNGNHTKGTSNKRKASPTSSQ